jgi:hypothetical protein
VGWLIETRRAATHYEKLATNSLGAVKLAKGKRYLHEFPNRIQAKRRT